MSFRSVFEAYSWDEVKAGIYAKTAADVERALATPRRTLDDFQALISPAAAPYLEQMAQLSQYLTRQAVGQFDVGPAAAFSLIYFLVVLLFSYVFYTAMTHAGQGEAR